MFSRPTCIRELSLLAYRYHPGCGRVHGGSFITSFIRNRVYETLGVPGGIFSLWASACDPSPTRVSIPRSLAGPGTALPIWQEAASSWTPLNPRFQPPGRFPTGMRLASFPRRLAPSSGRYVCHASGSIHRPSGRGHAGGPGAGCQAGHAQVEPLHLLLALLNEGGDNGGGIVAPILEKVGVHPAGSGNSSRANCRGGRR